MIESTGLRVVLTDHRLPDLPESECPQAFALLPACTDGATHLGDLQCFSDAIAYADPSRAADAASASASRRCRSMLGGATSSIGRPRRAATSSGRCNQLERGNGGVHHVDRVVTAQRLGQDVVHASAFQHRTRGTAGDHTGTGAGRTQHHHARGGLTLHRDARWCRRSAGPGRSSCALPRRPWRSRPGTSLALP